MKYPIFHFIHLLSVFLLVGTCVYAIAAPTNRKKLLMWSGIASLVVFISGFGLLGIMKLGLPVWSIVKMVCWLVLSCIVGLAFRMPEKRGALLYTSMALVAVAVLMVSFKPFV